MICKALYGRSTLYFMEVEKMRFAIGFLSGSIVTLFAAGMFVLGGAVGDMHARKNQNEETEANTIEE